MNNRNHVPIVIASVLPFRLVKRENELWAPSINDINDRNYDYVKLSRLSTFLDVGIRPFSIGIGFDGSLILPAIDEFRNRDTALEKFNETLGILLLGGIYTEAVLPVDISIGLLTLDGYTKLLGGGDGPNAKFHRAIRTKHAGALDVILLFNPPSLEIAEISDAYEKGKQFYQKLKGISPVLLLNGASNYVNRHWTESLIFIWTSIEQIVNCLWVDHIVNQKQANIAGRSTFLKDFRTWTTSTRIEVLFQRELIDTETYKLINLARKARNDFIHNGKGISGEVSLYALSSLFRLMSLIISDFKSTNLLQNSLNTIVKHEKGDLIPNKSSFSTNEVSHWLPIPPLPGDPNWGDKEYEIIEDLVLQPLD
ncbi:MAG: hypothetical protein JW987_15755 [Anaerolineaceae bacterium]|nr:hypothetical protein [Anaerolineaceae bacterium]